MSRRRGTRRRDQAGSVSLETLIGLPALMVLTVLVVAAGWYVTGRSAVSSAANEAARAATLARGAGDAERLALSAARVTLDNSDLRCQDSPTVVVDTSGFAVPDGQPAQVTVTVTCVVPLAGFGVPGLGDQTVTATATSALDTYRGRG
ncbi:MAG: pilus assembly protein [Micrococcales bacterium]|nr:pilus assembly protein [Micrococcales bacterium]